MGKLKRIHFLNSEGKKRKLKGLDSQERVWVLSLFSSDLMLPEMRQPKLGAAFYFTRPLHTAAIP